MNKSAFTTPAKLIKQSHNGTLVYTQLFPGVELSVNHFCGQSIQRFSRNGFPATRTMSFP